MLGEKCDQEIKIKVMSREASSRMVLSPLCTMQQLKQKLAEQARINVDSVVISKGYCKPREIVDFSKPDSTISECNIVSGDLFHVTQKPAEEIGPKNVPQKEVINKEVINNEVINSEVLDENELNPGILMRKVVPGDNSCLFTSLGFVLNGKVDPSCAEGMREIVANVIAQDPIKYSEGVLSRPNPEYCEWIKDPNTWGGGIEVSILSAYYGIEIVVVNSLNGIISRFGEDNDYSTRVFLLFDGIHYDPLYLEREGHPIKTMFETKDSKLLRQASELAKEANSSRQFTDLQKFTLTCADCGVMFSGQKEASEHAKDTGHANFREVMP